VVVTKTQVPGLGQLVGNLVQALDAFGTYILRCITLNTASSFAAFITVTLLA
jgi:hypothetical protein